MNRLLPLFLLAVSAYAQKSTGEIRGTVQDPGDAVVPRAEVTAKDTATGLTFATLTGAEGAYIIPNLLPGSYSVTVTAQGFRTRVLDKVIVETGRTTEVPVTLTVGGVAETIEVVESTVA